MVAVISVAVSAAPDLIAEIVTQITQAFFSQLTCELCDDRKLSNHENAFPHKLFLAAFAIFLLRIFSVL